MNLGIEESSPLKRRRQDGSTEGGGGCDMNPVDRISNLPEALITHILSFLPTKWAIGTSVLSKSWRLRWTTVTAFDLSCRQWPNCQRFVEFVNLVFENHTESINKLRLSVPQSMVRHLIPFQSPVRHLITWINAAIARNVRVLDLASVPLSAIAMTQHTDEDYDFDFPAALYTCGTLEIVKLRGPFRVKLPDVVSLPKLAVLELICVKYECMESFGKLISACPVLQTLKIERYHHHGDLPLCKVSSPSLRRLEICFHSCIECNFYDMKLVIHTPVLQHLVLDSLMFSKITCIQQAMPVNEVEIRAICATKRPDGVARLMQACDGVKVMRLKDSPMLALAASMPVTFGRLTKLVVEFRGPHWSNLLGLIDRCINLQVLDISVLVSQHAGSRRRKHPICVPGCLSSSLKHVYFNFSDGLEDEMAMLKLLLHHGLLIESVTLGSSFFTRFSDTDKSKILKEVSLLPRASTSCKISFL